VTCLYLAHCWPVRRHCGRSWSTRTPYDLRPGEYTWHPERSGDGPLAIIVSIPEQRVFVYRNGIRVASSTCSTGKPGHATPAGVFTILQKDKHHHSSTYDNAPMPNMNRLTWSGVALHAGNLPGYPASHGCVRLPLEFSALLFTITHVGTPVIIATATTQPTQIIHPGMALGSYAESEFEQAVAHLKKKELPAKTHEANKTPPVALLISSAERTGYLFENGAEISRGDVVISDPTRPLGSHMYVLSKAHNGAKGLEWQALGYHETAASAAHEADVIKRIRAAPALIAAIQARMHPGLTMILTDKPAAARNAIGEQVCHHEPGSNLSLQISRHRRRLLESQSADCRC
jgi:hypothetical protein